MTGLVALWNPVDGQGAPSERAFALFVRRVQKNHGCAQCPPLTSVIRDLGRIPKVRRGQTLITPRWYRNQPVVKVLAQTTLAREAPYRDRYHAILALRKLGAGETLRKVSVSLKRLTQDPLAKQLVGVCAKLLGRPVSSATGNR